MFVCGRLLADARRQVARFRNNVHGFRDLWIVSRDEHTVAHDTPVSGGNYVEAQLEFDERTIAIDNRRRSLELRIARYEIAIRFEQRVGDLELRWLKFSIKLDACDSIRLETTNTSVHKLACESKRRAQQTALCKVHRSRANRFVR